MVSNPSEIFLILPLLMDLPTYPRKCRNVEADAECAMNRDN